jgi:hypothetical protein
MKSGRLQDERNIATSHPLFLSEKFKPDATYVVPNISSCLMSANAILENPTLGKSQDDQIKPVGKILTGAHNLGQLTKRRFQRAVVSRKRRPFKRRRVNSCRLALFARFNAGNVDPNGWAHRR